MSVPPGVATGVIDASTNINVATAEKSVGCRSSSGTYVPRSTGRPVSVGSPSASVLLGPNAMSTVISYRVTAPVPSVAPGCYPSDHKSFGGEKVPVTLRGTATAPGTSVRTLPSAEGVATDRSGASSIEAKNTDTVPVGIGHVTPLAVTSTTCSPGDKIA